MTHNTIITIQSPTYNTYNDYYTNNIHAIFTSNNTCNAHNTIYLQFVTILIIFKVLAVLKLCKTVLRFTSLRNNTLKVK